MPENNAKPNATILIQIDTFDDLSARLRMACGRDKIVLASRELTFPSTSGATAAINTVLTEMLIDLQKRAAAKNKY